MSEWFYAQGREKCGPVSGAQLGDFMRTGVVTPGTLVWSKSLTEWTPAIQVPGLMQGGEPALEAAPDQGAAPAQGGGGELPWAGVGEELAPSGSFASAAPAGPAQDIAPAQPDVADTDPFAEAVREAEHETTNRDETAGVALEFSKKRKKPKHMRFGTKVKNLVVRVAALVIAVGILGGGGYLGAQYMGVFDEPVPARLRYLPDNPDFVFTMNLPKTMAVAQAMGADSQQIFDATSVVGMSFDPSSVQDVTVAGDVESENWIVVATLSSPIDIERMFPGGAVPDKVRAGGEKIFYNREMAGYGMNFGFVTPSKSVLVIGPVETLRAVMERRGAPLLAKGFERLLDQENSDAWMAGAGDIDALWRMADDGLPMELTDEQRWLAQSVASVNFSFSGSGEYDFLLEAQCKNAKDAPLIAKKAESALAEQRQGLLEMLHRFGQPVDENTRTPLDGVEFVVGNDGLLTVKQHFDKKMLELGTHQLAAAGLAEP